MADKLFKTENLSRICGILEFCHSENAMGIVLGKSGAGKTTALRAWASKKKDALYLEVGDNAYSRKDVLIELLEKAGGTVATRSLQELKRQIIELFLGKKITLLIIDQANYLPVSVFNVLNCIRETANAGLVMAGTHKLETILTKGNRSLELEQFYSRIDYKYNADKVTKADLVNFLDAENVEHTKEFDMLVNQLLIKVNGSGQLRTVVKTLSAARKVWKQSKSTEFLPEHVFKAMEYVI